MRLTVGKRQRYWNTLCAKQGVMHNILEDIARRKRAEVDEARVSKPLDQLARESEGFTHKSRFMQHILRAQDNGAIIAEIKLASPTHTALGAIDDVESRARMYEKAGADAISFITEKHYFKTELAD